MKSVLADRLFHLKENGTTVRRECFASLTTFVTMAYILAVNPAILGAAKHGPGAVFTFLRLWPPAPLPCSWPCCPTYPFPGPGHGAERLLRLHRGHQTGLLLADGPGCGLPGGLLFIVLSVTSVREAIFNSIPRPLKLGVTWGIGLFILFIGLQNSKLISGRPLHHAVGLPFREAIASGEIRSVGLGAALAFAGILLTAILTIRRVRAPCCWASWPCGGRLSSVSSPASYVPNAEQAWPRPARLLRGSGRPQPGSHLLCRWTSPGCFTSIF